MLVKFDQAAGVGTVTSSRPDARNTWGIDFSDGIREHFAAMEEDDDIRCAVLTGFEC